MRLFHSTPILYNQLSHSLPAESRTQQCLWHKKYYNIWVGKGLYCYPPCFFFFFFVFRLIVELLYLTYAQTIRACDLAWQLRRSTQSSRKKAAPYWSFVEFVLDVAKIRRICEPAVFVTGASWSRWSRRVHRVYAGTKRRIQSVNDMSRPSKFSVQNSALTGYARRMLRIGNISQTEFHQLHTKKNILVFSLVNTCTLLL